MSITVSWLALSYLLIGVFLCLVVIGQIAFWSSDLWKTAWSTRRELRSWQTTKRQEFDRYRIEQASRKQSANQVDHVGSWSGWRLFRVAELKQETPLSRSVYLVPADGKPVASFRPGQYLTLRLQLPDQKRPVVRCYSLSTAPDRLPYRITVKQVTPRDSQTPGSVSEYINQRLQVGDLLEVKPPAGEFTLRQADGKPIVMLAAGVGITPIYSMLCGLLSGRGGGEADPPVILFHGNSNRREHLFAAEIAELAAAHPRLIAVNCYSQASSGELDEKVPCHFRERVSIPLVQRLLPSLAAEFYLCGPPEFMKENYAGLLAAGVSPEAIHHEAFGPASVEVARSCHPLEAETEIAESMAGLIAFTRSGKKVSCPSGKSVLELAEDLEIPIDSGCRAGNCGTCAVRLLKGSVRYLKNNPATGIETGTVLACIAQPDGEIQVEA